MLWDREQYPKFAGERLQVVVDPYARVEVTDPPECYELAAGVRNVPHLVRKPWPRARITMMDGLREMLRKAAAAARAIAWECANLVTCCPTLPVGFIYSNAALHWIGDCEQAVREWVEGTGPRPLLDTVEEPGSTFEAISCDIELVVPCRQHRRILFPFKRLVATATGVAR